MEKFIKKNKKRLDKKPSLWYNKIIKGKEITKMTSRHYAEDRQYREENIKKYLGGEGKVVFDTVIYDTKRKNYYHYQITEHAVIIIKAIDKNLIITKLLARPTRLKRLWADVPQNILEIAIANSRDTRRVA